MIVNKYLKATRFKVKVGVHVGAHVAGEAQKYETLGIERLIWFEADDEAAHWARETLARRPEGPTEHILVEALVSDVDGVDTEFHVFNNHGGSSSMFRATKRLHQYWPKLRETGQVKRIRSARLDTLLDQLSVDPVDVGLLVFDVQGAELLCLRGAGRYLDEATFVEVEVSKEEIYAGGALATEVDALLVQRGFTLVSDVPWHGDAVYARIDRLTKAERAAVSAATAAIAAERAAV